MARYIRKGCGGIFEHAQAKRGLSPIALTELLAVRYPGFFKPWQSRVGEIDSARLEELVSRVPPARMSAAAGAFALAFMENSRKLITEIP